MLNRVGLFLLVVSIHFACAQQANKPWGETRVITYNGISYESVRILENNQIRLWHKSTGDTIYNTFKRLLKDETGVVCAMNAGMFNPAFEPVGLFIENGKKKQDLNLNEGYGNFHLLPNGVFSLTDDGRARVTESHNFDSLSPKVKYATQSGPMLVIDGEIHPAFRNGSKNKHIRNGIGVNQRGEVVFAISNKRCNFYDFATVFRDSLGCRNALYLDGAISKMYNVQSQRKEDGRFGVIVGVVD